MRMITGKVLYSKVQLSPVQVSLEWHSFEIKNYMYASEISSGLQTLIVFSKKLNRQQLYINIYLFQAGFVVFQGFSGDSDKTLARSNVVFFLLSFQPGKITMNTEERRDGKLSNRGIQVCIQIWKFTSIKIATQIFKHNVPRHWLLQALFATAAYTIGSN